MKGAGHKINSCRTASLQHGCFLCYSILRISQIAFTILGDAALPIKIL
nr:MAG TPA: hypothetical protein [Caudoviricetes sp.]